MIALIVLCGLATAIGALLGASLAVVALVKVAVRIFKRRHPGQSPESIQPLTTQQEDAEFQRIIATEWLQH